MIDEYTKELERALNPRKWDKELNDAWHRNIPDLQKAFDEIREIAKNRSITGGKMKHTIEIDGLPEGWEPVAFRIGNPKEHIIDCGEVLLLDSVTKFPCLIIKKKQPRRIVLEETGQDSDGRQQVFHIDNVSFSTYSRRVWKQVKESNLSLNNEEPKLSLTVDECSAIYQSMCKYNASIDALVLLKIREFLRNK